MKKNNNFNIFIIILLSILLFETPIFARKPPDYRRWCYSNQRVLDGAIEMYNMDHTPSIEQFYPGREYEELENLLIKEKYLKESLDFPTINCSYGGFNLTSKSSVIFCKEHGSIKTDISKDPIIPDIPEYDHSKEIPFSNSYYQKQKDRLDARKRRKAWDHFLQSDFTSFILILLLVASIFGLIRSILKGGIRIVKVDDGKEGLSFNIKLFSNKKNMDDYFNKIKEENDTKDIL